MARNEMSRLLSGTVLLVVLAVSLISSCNSLHPQINKNSIWPTGGKIDMVDVNTTHDADTAVEHLQICPLDVIQEYTYVDLVANWTGYSEGIDAYFVANPTPGDSDSDRIATAMDKPTSSLLALKEELKEAQRKIVETEQRADEAWKRVEELEKALLRAEERGEERLQKMENKIAEEERSKAEVAHKMEQRADDAWRRVEELEKALLRVEKRARRTEEQLQGMKAERQRKARRGLGSLFSF